MRLKDRVAIVTGANTGIGRGIAERFAAEGAAVVVDYITHEEYAREVADGITANGGRAMAVNADVTSMDEMTALIGTAVDTYGRLDIMVNNAGIEERREFLEMPLAVMERILAVDLKGPWIGSQLAARQMVRQGNGGRIINISSVHEDLPTPTSAAYCAAKGGLRMLMRTLALELAPYGITVNNIGPGAIDTSRGSSRPIDPAQLQKTLEEIPEGRRGQPSDVAAVAVFLASDEAAYVTGSTYFVDGGLLRMAENI